MLARIFHAAFFESEEGDSVERDETKWQIPILFSLIIAWNPTIYSTNTQTLQIVHHLGKNKYIAGPRPDLV